MPRPVHMDELEKAIEAFLRQFQEHHTPCAIRVFVTMNEGGNSFGKSWGGGDFYSMLGYVAEWMDTQREANRIETRKRNSEPSEPDAGAF